MMKITKEIKKSNPNEATGVVHVKSNNKKLKKSDAKKVIEGLDEKTNESNTNNDVDVTIVEEGKENNKSNDADIAICETDVTHKAKTAQK